MISYKKQSKPLNLKLVDFLPFILISIAILLTSYYYGVNYPLQNHCRASNEALYLTSGNTADLVSGEDPLPKGL